MADIDKHDTEDKPLVPDGAESAAHSPEQQTSYKLPTPQSPNPGFGERIAHALKVAWAENRQFFLLLTCIVFFKSAVADLSSISGASMQPTLLDGDKVWVK
jgi:phage repressor protein C with HTH and peptisase S24 domain